MSKLILRVIFSAFCRVRFDIAQCGIVTAKGVSIATPQNQKNAPASPRRNAVQAAQAAVDACATWAAVWSFRPVVLRSELVVPLSVARQLVPSGAIDKTCAQAGLDAAGAE